MNGHQYKVTAAKFDYEYMGKTSEDLVELYGFPLARLEQEIDEKGWQRKLDPVELPKTKDMQEFADRLVELSKSKLSVISLFRQMDNQPLYASIEKALLEKILSLVGSLDTDSENGHPLMHDKIGDTLLKLAKTVESIQARNPIDLVSVLQQKVEEGGNKVIVQIQNQIQ